ncbi:YybH family protein [Mesorhizobium sp. IMUNJ 23033]|uniref:YybH family protein n=1 Tax=Mesorhizobium sp. IMUNJ 23033 TaxID=3378039 RepID=UPI00384C290B
MRYFLATFCFVALVICGGEPAAAQTAQSSIEANNADFVAKFAAKDAKGVAQHYTEDAVAFPPNEDRVAGRESVQKMWQGWIDAGLTDLTLKAAQVEESGNLAYEEGIYSIKIPGSDGKTSEEIGKYIIVWKKGADGEWRLHRDIWNANPAKK